MKTVLGVFAALWALGAAAASAATVETNICVVSFSDVPKTLTVTDVTNRDWVNGDNYRPDKNFNNVVVGPYHQVCQRLDLKKAAANPSFTFVIGSERTVMQFDQGIATWTSLSDYATENMARVGDMIWSVGAKQRSNVPQAGSPCQSGIHCYAFSIGP
mgnify:CR=1 FL=1